MALIHCDCLGERHGRLKQRWKEMDAFERCWGGTNSYDLMPHWLLDERKHREVSKIILGFCFYCYLSFTKKRSISIGISL